MRQFVLTASILTGLLLSACAKNPEIDVETISGLTEAAQQDIRKRETLITANPDKPSTLSDTPPLLEVFQDLDPRDISRAELDEYLSLQKEQKKNRQRQYEALRKSNQQTPNNRRSQPKYAPLLSKAKSKRFRILEAKFQNAQIRKKYKDFDPKILSEDEVEELIILEQAQTKNRIEQQEKFVAWTGQDPATRGPRPNVYRDHLRANPRRLQELKGKINVAKKIKRVRDRVEKLSSTHNISVSESEISELVQIETEQQEFQIAMSKAMMEVQKETGLNGVRVSETDVIDKFPKDLVQKMFESEMRKQAIEAPLQAAEKADRIQNSMAELSKQSGIPILSGEITETIALNAEKDRITARTRNEAMQKWLAEGGPLKNTEPLKTDEDYARIKEIEARLKTIAAPMTEARNALREAENPAWRQIRLDQEQHAKWRTDWQDKKQAGEIPADVPLTSPSYAELQEHIKNYAAELETRAEKVGYVIAKADMKRLDSLNQKMLDVRKAVYDMEVDGSSQVKGRNGFKVPAFGLRSGMYKIKLIKQKQRDILADLSSIESQGNTETGTQQFRHNGIGQFADQSKISSPNGAEAMIESFRAGGLKISQSEADDLLLFEQDLEDW